MNEADYNELRELSWLRELTPAEQARVQEYLSAHPAAREDWAAETRLDQLLGALPDAPVASNFTALVMQAVERQTTQPVSPRSKWNFFIPVWAQRMAAACLVMSVGLLVYHEQQVVAREALGKKVALLADALSASGPETLQHFDSICRLSDTPPKADTELIGLMK